MRVLLAQYADLRNLRVQRLYISKGQLKSQVTGIIETRILTDHEKNTARQDLIDVIGHRNDFHATHMINQVMDWKTRKRVWKVQITGHRSSSEKNSNGQMKSYVSLELMDTDFQFQRSASAGDGIPGQHIPADIEVLLEIKGSPILFNETAQTTSGDRGGRCVKDMQVVPAVVLKKLKSISPNHIKIKVYGMFKNVEPKVTFGSHVDIAESNWKIFKDQCLTDVTIVTKDAELIDCHRLHLARNSRFLSEQLFNPHQKQRVVQMPDLNRLQVEAFVMYQYCGFTDRILESPHTSLLVLRTAKSFQIRELWHELISSLLRKDYSWFPTDVSKELTKLLGSFKQNDEDTKQLLRKLSNPPSLQTEAPPAEAILNEEIRKYKLSEPPNHLQMSQFADTEKETCSQGEKEVINLTRDKCSVVNAHIEEPEPDQLREAHAFGDDGGIEHEDEDMTLEPGLRSVTRPCEEIEANLANLAENDEDNVKKCENKNYNLGNLTVKANIRRSRRLQVTKPEGLPKRGLHPDESWQAALQRDAENKKNHPECRKRVYGPRDIRKDPVLPKIAIFHGAEVKVEKVEPLEDEREGSH